MPNSSSTCQVQSLRKITKITQINSQYAKHLILHISTEITQNNIYYTYQQSLLKYLCFTQLCHLVVLQKPVHVNRAAVCWQLWQCHISKFVSLKFKVKDSSFSRKQSNFCVFPHVTTIPAQHSVPLKGCVPDAMLVPSTQRVTQVSATYSSFPDIALNPQAPPSRCGQILIDSF